MNREKFEKYATIKNQIKELEAEAELLAPEVLAEMGEVEELEVAEVGKFCIGHRRKWTYPESIESARKALKTAEVEAQRVGDASYEEKPYLIFSGIKKEDENQTQQDN